jgi:hypothetical protein
MLVEANGYSWSTKDNNTYSYVQNAVISSEQVMSWVLKMTIGVQLGPTEGRLNN